jgi:DNA/RNA-binding domain of Phe-tRNA-synthetase-like protein
MRTRLKLSARRMWFVLEAHGTMPDYALGAAADMLCYGLSSRLLGCRMERIELQASP